ncbi:hypothetical protein GNI_013750 [Gregarina niphandrodes]|uniref:Uncharacterized protein n=1 Tax=Gregarina niphandrodes TaxID=110365 RepID=A0A023BCI1_GRENI|nr:hypothetical protein GNI_013750 [Gregarina niphandrodes]EZG83892.1 hypothetical protein GNI_013750 [Gregarina niphandrodes]|eukprot:XP_011128891.1 hypothetical protein GNI_013750 [Gregarina niphandrodes]
MRALKPRKGNMAIADMLALLPTSSHWWLAEENVAGVQLSRHAESIWMHTVGRRSPSYTSMTGLKILACARRHANWMFSSPGMMQRALWFAGRDPMYTRRSMEEYELWRAVENSRAMNWVFQSRLPAGKGAQTGFLLTAGPLPTAAGSDWSPESGMEGEAAVESEADDDSEIGRLLFELSEEGFTQLSAEASAPPGLFALPPNKGSRLSRCLPGLILWADFRRNCKNMPRRTQWERLALLSRWYPEQACQAVLKDLEEVIDLPARLAPVLLAHTVLTDPGGPQLAVSPEHLKKTANLWWFDRQNEGSVLNLKHPLRGSSPETDPIVDKIAADVLSFLSSLTNLLRKKHQSQATHGPSGGQVVSGSWLACADEIRYWMKKVAMRRKAMLKARYKAAYRECREQLEAAYFSETSVTAVELPVGCRNRVRAPSDFQNYELRQWAFFEEELVLALIHGCIRLEAMESWYNCRLVAKALDFSMSRVHRAFKFSVSTGQFACLYEWQLDDAIEWVATEQAQDYACRVGGAIATTLWDLAGEDVGTGGDLAVAELAGGDLDGGDLVGGGLVTVESDGPTAAKRRKRDY